MENYKNVSQDIRNQLNAEAEAVQIILTRIYNDIYSTVDACLNACEMWKATKRPQQAATRNKGKAIVNSLPLNYDQKPTMVAEDDALSKEKDIDKLMALMNDADDKPKDQELEAHYLYMAQIQEVTLDADDNSGPIFDVKPLKKVQNDDDNYFVFANDIEHPEQPEYVNVTYPDEQGDTNITTDSLHMSNNRGEADQDEDEDLSKERDLS
nr:hypothetical protein [Tanacetum cinerariifolium]